jgi:multiple sugar transport system substrate-binding protein
MADDELSAIERPATRREFIKRAGTGVLIVYGGATAKTAVAGVPKYRGRELQNTLRIMQWSHFVPAYDQWFDNTYTKQWGQRNDTEVIVDHVNNAELPARGAAEVAAQSGHDLFQFLGPPAAHEDNVVPMNDIVQEVSKKLGKPTPTAFKSSFNPKTKKYFGFADNYVPDPAHYRRDLWRDVGRAPNSWADVAFAAPKLKEAGHPVGLGMSQELDSGMVGIALAMCYGGFIQNTKHRVTLNSRGTINALRTMRDIFKRGMTSEVFAWIAASNNQAFNSGRLSFAMNAISIARALETANPELSANTWIAPIPRGPSQRMGLEHVMGVYVIWKFSRQKRLAKKFLVDAQLNYTPHFLESKFYNFPGWSNGVRGGMRAIRRHAAADKNRPLGKYTILTTIAQRYTTNVGHPGFSNAAVDEIFFKWIIPQMYADVAQDKKTPAEAARFYDRQMRQIFQKWRNRGKI